MLYICRTGTYFHYKVPLCYLKLSNHKSTHSSRLWWIASWCSSHTWIRRLIWIRHPGWPGLQCRMPHLLTNVIPNKNIPPILTSHATSGIARLERNCVQEFQKGLSLPHTGFVKAPPQQWAHLHSTPCTPYCYAVACNTV